MKRKKPKPKWLIQDFSEYFFAEDKKLYKSPTNREIKRCMVNSSHGYYLNRKFYTLTAIRKMLVLASPPSEIQ